jgi:hypothetical protein
MSNQANYQVYPSLLDSYRRILEAEDIWLKYWGDSASPPHTSEQFRVLQIESFFDGLNRVDGVPSQPASRGTAFNEIVDCMVEHRKPVGCEVERVYENGEVTALKADIDGFSFTYPIDICRRFADKYRDAVCQYQTHGELRTGHGIVNLYGYIDELMPLTCHDIKTTGSYQFPQFKNHAQHLVYTHCLRCEGMPVEAFEYDVLQIPKGKQAWEVFSEIYTPTPNDAHILRDWVDEMLEFVIASGLAQDPKFFGRERPADFVGVPLKDISPDGLPTLGKRIINDIQNYYNGN